MSDAAVQVDVAIAGGGPAGMMAGLLFARAGLRVVVVEMHADFLRDFRGDTVHPSTLELFRELGLLDRLLGVPHNRLDRLSVRAFGRTLRAVDMTHLPVAAPFIALMPQWDFLNFVAGEARRYPGFILLQSCRASGVLEDAGRVAGLQLDDRSPLRARLTIACDGRDSTLRTALGARTRTIGAPMDVLWFRLPKPPGLVSEILGTFDSGRLVVTIDRGDYYQCALVIPKGGSDAVRARGLPAFRAAVRAVGPETAGADALTDWGQVSLLNVTVDRLDRWHRPGLLVIGDAAHAMSPIGGVGINLAIQDAVAAANILAGPMAAGADPDPLLRQVAARRLFPTRVTQGFQRLVQDRVVVPVLAGAGGRAGPPLALRLLDRISWLQRIPARLLGIGVRPEHIRSPALTPPAARP